MAVKLVTCFASADSTNFDIVKFRASVPAKQADPLAWLAWLAWLGGPTWPLETDDPLASRLMVAKQTGITKAHFGPDAITEDHLVGFLSARKLAKFRNHKV